ncbi:unnamed protein product [Soboliphyme baturini]|uniref:MFS domain-containing protein n=1 Tax=Soboliphyme baturini TaxID=241478 RepID=A0A183IXD8_9BILA|nr:unnamed protein product [Soboliphyme baturini]
MTHIDSRILLTTIVICAGGSFHFGFRLISFNPIESIMKRLLNDTSLRHYHTELNDQGFRAAWSFTVNLLPIGNIFGTLFTPLVSQRFGRKNSMYITAVMSMVGSLLSGLASTAESFELYAAGVFVTGLACGLILSIQPLYLVEISPTQVRDDIMAEIEMESRPISSKQLFLKPYLRHGFTFGLLAAAGVSFCGISAISSFSTVVLKEAGLSEHNAQYATIAISINSVVASCISSLITDRLGRRPLLVVGYATLTILNTLFMIFSFVSRSYALMWAGYVCVVIDVSFTFVFGIGPAPLQWYVMAEMVPQNARSLAQSWAVISSAAGLIVVNLMFLSLNGVIYEFAYLVFIIPSFSLAIYFYRKFPETKNKTIIQIMELLSMPPPLSPKARSRTDKLVAVATISGSSEAP